MTQQEIKTLLDKYFEGETSLEEEAQLRTYFNSSFIDPEFQPFQSLFQFFETEKEASLSEDFEQNLLRMIQEKPAPHIRRLIPPNLMRVAAAAAVILGIVVLFPKQPHSHDAVAINWEQYEPQTEEEALAEATAALELLASKLNRGAKKASKEIHKIEKTSEIFK